MNEQLGPEEERREFPEQVETPTERVREMTEDLRRRAEDLGYSVQERARELGEMVGERTSGAVGEVRYLTEQARVEAASRLEETRDFLSRQTNEIGENSREAVRRRPGTAVGLAAVGGILLAVLARRLFANIGRR